MGYGVGSCKCLYVSAFFTFSVSYILVDAPMFVLGVHLVNLKVLSTPMEVCYN